MVGKGLFRLNAELRNIAPYRAGPAKRGRSEKARKKDEIDHIRRGILGKIPPRLLTQC